MVLDRLGAAMIGLYSKILILGKKMIKCELLPYILMGDVVYPMRPWFYSLFKGEKYGLPRV
jgi:hypothetical protein